LISTIPSYLVLQEGLVVISLASWGVRGDILLATPPRRSGKITAHIIGEQAIIKLLPRAD
jgi:hypothetical protein